MMYLFQGSQENVLKEHNKQDAKSPSKEIKKSVQQDAVSITYCTITISIT